MGIETAKTKLEILSHLMVHSRKGKVQSRVAVLERGAHHSTRQEYESVCGSPMCHLGARGQLRLVAGALRRWPGTLHQFWGACSQATPAACIII